jgi:hypothetical protein
MNTFEMEWNFVNSIILIIFETYKTNSVTTTFYNKQ